MSIVSFQAERSRAVEGSSVRAKDIALADAEWDDGSDRHYGKLATATSSFFSNLKTTSLYAKRASLGNDFRYKESLNGRFSLWANQWIIRGNGKILGTARMVLIQGQKNEIINTWVFPTLPSQLPVFAAELIAMGGHQRLSFMDIQVPGMTIDDTLIVKAIAPVRQSHRKLLIDELPPDWAITDTLGQYIFRRTGYDSQFPEISACYADYLNVFIHQIWTDLLKIFNTQLTLTETSATDANMTLLREYQLHHLHSSPGNLFLSKIFGSEWTHSFLHDFLFSEP